MATTVEARPSRRAPEPVAPAPWYKDRKRQAIAGAGAIAFLALSVWFVITSGQRKEEFASRQLAQAIATAERGNLPQASSELQRVIQTYPGTDAAAQAVLALNQIRLGSGQGQLAAVNLREFVATKPAARYAAPAYALLGAAEENANRYSEAAAAYERAAAEAELPYMKAAYLVDAGRAYRLAGKIQEAVKAYRAVVEKYPSAPALPEAQVRLAELTAGST
jgi:TolA-binding protein